MIVKKCDIREIRSIAMRKAQSKVSELKKHGIPVPKEVFSDIMKISYEEARNECKAAETTLNEEQMEIVRKLCGEDCTRHYTAK